MSYLIDTNIISEVRKQHRCDPNVATWFASIENSELFLSENGKGIEKCRAHDAAKASALATWLDDVRVAFDGRILSIDQAVVVEWGRMSSIRSVPVIDALLAATAKVHGLTLVTRNVTHVADLGAAVLDPFAPSWPA